MCATGGQSLARLLRGIARQFVSKCSQFVCEFLFSEEDVGDLFPELWSVPSCQRAAPPIIPTSVPGAEIVGERLEKGAEVPTTISTLLLSGGQQRFFGF